MPADQHLVRIRKLLAKAEDPSITPEEAELYTAKATELVAEYGIDQAMLAHDHRSDDPVDNRVVVLERPYAADKADLLATVAVRLRCACVRRTDRLAGRKEISLHLFGHESDLVRVEILFTSLLVQSATALAQVPVPPHEHKAAFRRSWMAGFRNAIHGRLRDAERRAQQAADDHRPADGPSTAVVLADRDTQVLDSMNRTYPHLTKGRGRTLSGAGGAAGYDAGRRADLGGGRVTRNPGRVLPAP